MPLIVRLSVKRKRVRIGDAVVEYVRGGENGGSAKLIIHAPKSVPVDFELRDESVARPAKRVLRDDPS